jgi:hypothetical protein
LSIYNLFAAVKRIAFFCSEIIILKRKYHENKNFYFDIPSSSILFNVLPRQKYTMPAGFMDGEGNI